MLSVLTSHLGYNTSGSKKAVVLTREPVMVTAAFLVDDADGTKAELAVGPELQVDEWSVGTFRRVDFTHVRAEGRYRVEVTTSDGVRSSEPFVIGSRRIHYQTLSDVLYYFKAVRSSGEIDRKDRSARFYGDDSGRTVDARGGWLDASGDHSKFLSHLNYTRMMNPQQTPLCAWAFLAAREQLAAKHPGLFQTLGARTRDEGLHGADFLVRFQSPEGYFYTAIFDALTKDLDERVINAPLRDSVRTTRWQAAYRQGGGMAIAALARAATVGDHGDFTAEDYFHAARRGFLHLEKHNLDYLHDGTETVIDDYCALMAAVELTDAAGTIDAPAPEFEEAAARRARSLMGRYVSTGKGFGSLRGDAEGRPFFHAAESGLPAVALMRFAEVHRDSALAAEARATAVTLVRDAVRLADEVDNPFGYFRQYVQPAGSEPRTSFFYPHDNETGYWWQGENANICSIAYAALLAAELPECDPDLGDRLTRLAEDQLQWVMGLNPFDSCMIQGRGRNNVEYSTAFQNVPGGILNGVTSGFDNERDIAFMPAEQAASGDSWRWAEQWIPHSAWFLLAVSASR
ncbi:glycoside hydrolase family 9 protein [Planotetraspora sp. A-T 1434]|uniref:glycoside hydrolase family 9 protein n=1 Tax=Planotetraspora sp. A-T 1434 TaxID=2979219 RepID=UPI0021BFE835|nr:glycoside hydrolase family 9 protein [Planotetraspora sp. A-T 1434]MCT9929787.1 glycoside hydrolase family 9 protein [Planotetraspora sp. A-T 1434]